MSFDVIVTKVVGYVFFDFTVGVTLSSTVVADDVNIDDTKLVVREALASVLGIDESSITISQIYLGGTSKDNATPLLRRGRFLTGSTNLFADSTLALEIDDDDASPASSNAMADGAQQVFTTTTSLFSTALSNGALNTAIQTAAASHSNTLLSSATVDSSLSSVPSSNEYTFGATNNPAQAVSPQSDVPTPSGDSGSNAVGIGVGVSVGVAAIVAVAGFTYYRRVRFAVTSN